MRISRGSLLEVIAAFQVPPVIEVPVRLKQQATALLRAFGTNDVMPPRI
jgi:hypothetical protein